MQINVFYRLEGRVDAQGRKFGTNTDTDGRFHSKWLNMMYPRLYPRGICCGRME